NEKSAATITRLEDGDFRHRHWQSRCRDSKRSFVAPQPQSVALSKPPCRAKTSHRLATPVTRLVRKVHSPDSRDCEVLALGDALEEPFLWGAELLAAGWPVTSPRLPTYERGEATASSQNQSARRRCEQHCGRVSH